MPHQHICVARRAIHIADQGVEPHQARGKVIVHHVHCRVKVDGARQIVQPHVQPVAGANQVLNLGVGLGAGQVAVQVQQHDFRHRQAQRTCHAARDDLGHQRAHALPGAPELEHIGAQVVGLDNRRHGAAFTQRRDIALHQHRAQLQGFSVHGKW
ncbi:hypothetical protein SDC9_192522 [bioreactor metagenome]|uniref:Uncharacterized protein n=1 Tax=bioreactor metagenome TaxID=1076179 RepID=A0A645I101_9ZZZZ